MVTEKMSKHRRRVGVELSSACDRKSRKGMELSQPGCVQQGVLGVGLEHRARVGEQEETIYEQGGIYEFYHCIKEYRRI